MTMLICPSGHEYDFELYHRHGCRKCRTLKDRARRRAATEARRQEKQERDRILWSRANDTLERAAVATGSSIEFITGPCMWREAMRPRRAAMVALRGMGLTLRQIGDILGRDHKSVFVGLTKAAREMESDPSFSALVEKIAA